MGGLRLMPRFCQCGCGQTFKPRNYKQEYIRGHYRAKFVRDRYEVIDLGFSSPCWVWQKHTNEHGYGILRVNGTRVYAHRFYYMEHVGPIPEGTELDHLCRHPICCNPEHLEAVTHRENMLRGNTLGARNAAKTHCVHGHPLSGDNLVPVSTRPNKRICRACDTARRRAPAPAPKDAGGEDVMADRAEPWPLPPRRDAA